MYVVMKRGVYMRTCVGVFTQEVHANNAAKAAIVEEPDDHHMMEVYWIQPNVHHHVYDAEKGIDIGDTWTLLTEYTRIGTKVTEQSANAAVPQLQPHHSYAYRLLEDDPMALDVWQDVVSAKR